jgi:hypothetical protein
VTEVLRWELRAGVEPLAIDLPAYFRVVLDE